MYLILYKAGDILFQIINVLILINVIFSWVRPNKNSPLVKFVYHVTEPILEPFKRFSIAGSIDFSPFLAILLIEFILSPLYKFIIGLIFA